jgi:phosphatidylglycerophosphatase A
VSDLAAQRLALWFGCGRVPRAPGTAGTLGALPLYLVLVQMGPLGVLFGAIAITLIGVWASRRMIYLLGDHDPQVVCIDEVAGVLLVLAAAPATFVGVVAAVISFRLLDVVKPWPARAAERLPAGWGVMMDDVVAGLWGAALMLAARYRGWL